MLVETEEKCVKAKLIWLLSLAVIGCGSVPSPSRDQLVLQAQSEDSSQRKNVQVSYYEGNGGKDIRFAVLPLTGKNLNENEKWILPFIEGNFVSDFNKYSAMAILDRQNIEKILQSQQEGLDLNFTDETQSNVGRMINSEYNLYGSITKISVNNYSIEFSISNTDSGIRKASYPPTLCTLNDIQGLGAIKEAAEDMLFQMGIILTDQGIQSLKSAVRQKIIDADIALSKGIAAERNGTFVEAMSYYYAAVSFDTSLIEANGRLSALSRTVSSGNTGESVRNDIQRRNEWVKITKDAELFFKAHMPYEIIYSPELRQGSIDYEKETVDLFSTIKLNPSVDFNIFDTLLDGLEASGKRIEWGFEFWPLFSDIFTEHYRTTRTNERNIARKNVYVDIALINDSGRTIANTEARLTSEITFRRGTIIRGEPGYNYGHIITEGRTGDYYHVDTSRVEAAGDEKTIYFRGINANDITDNLIIKIVSVNGINAERASNDGYIKITVGSE
jgi:hypothetical protein